MQILLKQETAGPCVDWQEHKMQEKQFNYEISLDKQQFIDELVYKISTGQAQMQKITIKEFTQD